MPFHIQEQRQRSDSRLKALDVTSSLSDVSGRMLRPRSSLARSCLALLCCIPWLSCNGNPAEPATDNGIEGSSLPPIVEDFEPKSSTQGSEVTLRVLGQGFDAGSRVDLLLDGHTSDKVQTLETRFVTTKELVADISIADDAAAGSYQV